MQHDIVHFEENVMGPVELVYPLVQENPPVREDPPVLDDQPLVIENQPTVIEDQPTVADQFGQEDTEVLRSAAAKPDTQIRVPHRQNTRLQQRRSETDRVLTTAVVPELKVRMLGSAVESITAFLEKRKREGTSDPSANVSVRQALKTRGDDAVRVIIKELTQIDVLEV
jgi:hypothetical protein